MIRGWIAVVLLASACGGGTSPRPAPVTPTPVQPEPPPPAASTVAWHELTGSVVEIRVTAPSERLRASVAAELAGVRGKPLDPDALRERLARVMQMPGIADVTVRGVQAAGGIELVVELTAQPVVRKVSAVEVGGSPIALGTAGVAPGAPLDPRRVNELVQLLRDRYLSKGHVEVDVTWRRVAVADGIELVLEVTPGPATTIAAVTFAGNKAIASKDLAALTAKWLVAGQPLVGDKLERAVIELQGYYYDRGYAAVKVRAPEPKPGPNTLAFEIEEGGQFRMGPIAITGDVPATDHPKYLKAFGVKKGDLFNRSAIVAGRERVLAAVGKPSAIVLPLTNLDSKARTVGLTLEINAGP